MKQFNKYPLFRRLLFLIVALVVSFILFVLVTTFKAKLFRVENNIVEVFVGDSHVRYAVNDSLLSNSLNLGNSSESIYFSYFKIKQIIQSSPNIKTIYLGFSFHNISEYYDQYIYGRYSRDVSPNYFYVLPIKQQLQMIKWNLKRLPAFLFSVLKSGIKTWLNKNTFQGGFDNHHSDVSANEMSMDDRLDFQYYTNGKFNSFSNLNLTYFDKIVKLCNELNVKLIILNTPLHHYLQTNVPSEFVNKYNSLITSKNIPTIDLSSLELANNCYQPEGDLLSKEGALETTKEILRIRRSHNYNPQH